MPAMLTIAQWALVVGFAWRAMTVSELPAGRCSTVVPPEALTVMVPVLVLMIVYRRPWAVALPVDRTHVWFMVPVKIWISYEYDASDVLLPAVAVEVALGINALAERKPLPSLSAVE